MDNNDFKTEGIIKIARGLQNVSILQKLDISNNNVGEKAAHDIAIALSHNTNLQELYLESNRFKAPGMSELAKALQCISTLTVLSISNNSVGEDAADDIAQVYFITLNYKSYTSIITTSRQRGLLRLQKP